MVLYMVGLGLGDENDITVKGLKIVQQCDLVVLEAYTSVLGIVDKEKLEALYGKPIVVADRDTVETQADEIILQNDKNVAFLVVGDPLCATTHTDLWLRARQKGIQVEIVHNASIMGAAASSGLSLYNFGQTVSIPFFEDNWKPTSFVPKIEYNLQGGMHTLCLLDIKVKEPDFKAMMKGKTEYLPPRFMSVATAAQQLITSQQLLLPDNNNNNNKTHYGTALCVGLARMGQPTQQIIAGTLEELAQIDMGTPLHSLIICGDVHDLEVEVLKEFLVEGSKYQFPTNNSEQ
ncbi:Diphthine methyl ester synthase [Seminavis robusta]|uniref:diphthine methyl ester synthase n=1 Tax=Seminavis robusta TaxID=568900 RepID=A0A9N8F0U1_9STRA|nr:Diphthine methyl ester synthase [Seminavis robusta]|eukprot:Sro2464_g328490.1 Diphthine methyl ester synthase (290) ;mRNA; f:4604-5473